MATIAEQFKSAGIDFNSSSVPTSGTRNVDMGTKQVILTDGSTIMMPKETALSPAIVKAVSQVGDEVLQPVTNNKTASGFTLKPMYYVIAIVVLVVAYFVYKKYYAKS